MSKIKPMPSVPISIEIVHSREFLTDRRTNQMEQPLIVTVMRGREVLTARALFSIDVDVLFRGRGGGDA
jgi:hypothetical protein